MRWPRPPPPGPGSPPPRGCPRLHAVKPCDLAPAPIGATTTRTPWPTTPTSPPPKTSSVRRGELHGYTRPSTPEQARTVVILSSDGIDDSPRPWLLGIELRERDPGDLLAIPVADRGWAYAGDLTRL